MTSVICINGDEMVGDHDRNEDCVKELERILQKAKDGEVIGFAAALQYRDGSNSGLRSGFIFDHRVVGCLMAMVTKISMKD